MRIVCSIMLAKVNVIQCTIRIDYNNISGKIMSLHISYILAIKVIIVKKLVSFGITIIASNCCFIVLNILMS